MGLWLKQGDDIIPVSGGVGGGGGTFDGEHVLTGDPDDPPTDWEEGQLLWDGNTTSLDGDEIALGDGHNHEALYLSLSGGALMGNLLVEGNLTARDTWTQKLQVDGSVTATGDLQVDGSATVEGNRVVTVTASTGTPPSGGEEGDIHIQV